MKGVNDLYVNRWPDEQHAGHMTGFYTWADEYRLFMGHTQAPTGNEREYTPHTTHPFETNNWIVSHNGVLENSEQLAREHLQHLDYDLPAVDTAVIPALLDDKYHGYDVPAIEHVCSLLKGTFACWMYSKLGRQAYLVRSGSTLFGDTSTGCFSSVKIPESVDMMLAEGVIYCVTAEGLTTVGAFEQSSPFFIL